MREAAKTDGANAEVVLFRKAIDTTREIVVVRSAIHPVSDLEPPTTRGARSEQPSGSDAARAVGCFSVSLQVVPRQRPPLTIATTVMLAPAAKPSGGVEVFDVLWYEGGFVLAVGTFDIQLWRVPVSLNPARPNIPRSVDLAFLSRWMADAAATYWDKTSVSVRLSLSEDGRVRADVDNLRVPNNVNAPHHTRFIQDADKWKFGIEKQE